MFAAKRKSITKKKDAGKGHQELTESILSKRLDMEKIADRHVDRIGQYTFGALTKRVPGMSPAKIKAIFKKQFGNQGIYRKNLAETVERAVQEVEKTAGVNKKVTAGEKVKIREIIEHDWTNVQRLSAIERADIIRERNLKVRTKEDATLALSEVKESMHEFGDTRTINNTSGKAVKKDPFKDKISGTQMSVGQAAQKSGFLGAGGGGGFSRGSASSGFAGGPKISGPGGAPSGPSKLGGAKPIGL